MRLIAKSLRNWRAELYGADTADVSRRRFVGNMSLRVLLLFASSYKVHFLVALIGPLAIALVLTFMLPPVYRAQTVLAFEVPADKHTDGIAGSPPSNREFINTEIELLTNPTIVEDTINRVGLANVHLDLPSVNAGPLAAMDAAVRAFQSSLRVMPSDPPNAIRVTFDNQNPTTSAFLLGQFIVSYQERRAKVVGYRRSEVNAKTVARDKQDLERLEHVQEATKTVFGVSDIPRQRAALLQHRADLDKDLQQNMDRIETLSNRLADLTQIRVRAGFGNSSSQTPVGPDGALPPNASVAINLKSDNVASTNETSKSSGAPRPGRQADSGRNSYDQVDGRSGLSPLQLAPRLLDQFITHHEGVQDHHADTYDARAKRDLQRLEDLEHAHPEPKAPVIAVEVSKQRKSRIQQQVEANRKLLQSLTHTSDFDTQDVNSQLAYVAKDPTASASDALASLTGSAKPAIGGAEAVELRPKGPSRSSISDQQSSLVEQLWQRTAAVQEGLVLAHASTATTSLIASPAIAQIDQDLASGQVQLRDLKAQQTSDTVSIGVIDQKLMQLERAEVQLNALNARIVSQNEVVRRDFSRYEEARSLDEKDLARTAAIVLTSDVAIPKTSTEPNTLLLAFGGIIASVLSAGGVAVFVARRLLYGPALELFPANQMPLPTPGRKRFKRRLD